MASPHFQNPDALNGVHAFHTLYQVPAQNEPVIPDRKRCDLRVALIQEELNELKQAIEDNNIVEVRGRGGKGGRACHVEGGVGLGWVGLGLGLRQRRCPTALPHQLDWAPPWLSGWTDTFSHTECSYSERDLWQCHRCSIFFDHLLCASPSVPQRDREW